MRLNIIEKINDKWTNRFEESGSSNCETTGHVYTFDPNKMNDDAATQEKDFKQTKQLNLT